jgi:sodium/bile acid cotransporter 7
MKNAVALMILLPLLHLGALFAFFSIFRYFTGNLDDSTTTPITTSTKAGKDTVAATFCASHKTLAFGLPLVNAVFAESSNLASYCAPIMLVHPIQLLIGTFLLPYFKQFTGLMEERDVAEAIKN